MKIETVEDLDTALAVGKYTSIGSYPLFYITSDGAALSYDTVKEEYERISESIIENLRDGWKVIAVDINWEDTELYDDHTGELIESAYGND